MNSNTKTVKAQTDFRVEIEALDGRRGAIDTKTQFVHSGFSALREPLYFSRVGALIGAAIWPGLRTSQLKPTRTSARHLGVLVLLSRAARK